MKELQFTLYEVFGYLLPGAVLTGAVGILFWAAFFPHHTIEFDLKSVEVWGTFLAAAYIVGHIAQGIGNAVVRRFESAEDHAIKTVLDPEIVAACKKKAKEMTGANVDKVSPKWLYRLCDDAVIRSGKLGEREVYVYREGFYRGTFIGSVFLVIGLTLLAVRLLNLSDNPEHPPAPFLAVPAVWCVVFMAVDFLVVGALWDHGKKKLVAVFALLGTLSLVLAVSSLRSGNWSASVHISRIELTAGRLLFFAALGAIGAWFLWHRYWRFAEYRVTHAMLGFLTIKDDKKTDPPKP